MSFEFAWSFLITLMQKNHDKIYWYCENTQTVRKLKLIQQCCGKVTNNIQVSLDAIPADNIKTLKLISSLTISITSRRTSSPTSWLTNHPRINLSFHTSANAWISPPTYRSASPANLEHYKPPSPWVDQLWGSVVWVTQFEQSATAHMQGVRLIAWNDPIWSGS